jgi:hypothetical protein
MGAIESLMKLSSIFHRTKSLVMETLYLAVSALTLIILYNNAELLNNYVFFRIKLGSFLLLVAGISAVKYLWSVLSFFRGRYRSLGIILKFVIMLAILVLVFYIFFNQETVFSALKSNLDTVDFSRFNPFAQTNISVNSTGL